jgi:hypothetical protein
VRLFLRHEGATLELAAPWFEAAPRLPHIELNTPQPWNASTSQRRVAPWLAEQARAAARAAARARPRAVRPARDAPEVVDPMPEEVLARLRELGLLRRVR